MFAVQGIHAYTNTQNWIISGYPSCSSTTQTITTSETVTSKDPIFASIGDLQNNYVVSITDNLGDSWQIANNYQYAPYAMNIEIWYVPSANPGTLTTLTLTWHASPASCLYVIYQLDTGPVANANNNGNHFAAFTYPTVTDLSYGISSQPKNSVTIGATIGQGERPCMCIRAEEAQLAAPPHIMGIGRMEQL